MASINTEQNITYLPGGITVVTGTLVTNGGTTSGLIIPGYLASAGDVLITEGSLNKARGIRKILYCGLVNSANSNAFKAVKTNDATADADLITVTCTANDTFNYMLIGIDQGQSV